MYLKNGETEIYYERTGHGQPVLFIHGAVEGTRYFKELAEYLRDFHEVITYDRRGNSRSSKAPDGDYSIQAQVSDAVALIESLDLQQVILVGHSAGGEVALDTFEAVPARVAHVIIYETPIYTLIMNEKPELGHWAQMVEDLRDSGNLKQATKEFAMSIGTMDDRARKKTAEEKNLDRQDFQHFIYNEFHNFTYYEPNMDFFKRNAKYITCVVGDRSMDSNLAWAMQLFAETIGCELLHTPGYHNLPYDLPKDFAVMLLGINAWVKR